MCSNFKSEIKDFPLLVTNIAAVIFTINFILTVKFMIRVKIQRLKQCKIKYQFNFIVKKHFRLKNTTCYFHCVYVTS